MKRTIMILLGMILVATNPAIAQEKSATLATTATATAAATTNIDRDWVFEFWYDGDLEKGTPERALQDELIKRAERKVAAARVPLDKINIRDNKRAEGYIRSPKEAFEMLPGWKMWSDRISKGDVVVQRGRVHNGELGRESFPILLGGPLEPDDVMDGLLKPVRVAQVQKAEQLRVAMRHADSSSTSSTPVAAPPSQPSTQTPSGTRVVAAGDNK